MKPWKITKMDRVTLENGQPTVQYEPAETMNTENPTFFFFFFFFSWWFVITSFAVSDTLYMVFPALGVRWSVQLLLPPYWTRTQPWETREVGSFLHCDKSICRPCTIPCNSWEHYHLELGNMCQPQFLAITRTFPSCSWKLFLLCFHAIAGIFPIFNWP